MKCTFCNSDIKDGATFCRFCGTKQITISQDTSNPSAHIDQQFIPQNPHIVSQENHQTESPHVEVTNIIPSNNPYEKQNVEIPNNSPKQNNNIQKTGSANNKKRILYIVLGLITIVIVGVLAYIAGSRNNDSTSTSNNTNDSISTGTSKIETTETAEEIITNDTSTVQEETTEEVLTESTTQETNPEIKDDNTTDKTTPFYGVWCFGSKSEDEAIEFANQMKEKGFNAKVLATTDWDNLNSELYYVVTADYCETEDSANQLLEEVQNAGYTDAYIKYSGNKY